MVHGYMEARNGGTAWKQCMSGTWKRGLDGLHESSAQVMERNSWTQSLREGLGNRLAGNEQQPGPSRPASPSAIQACLPVHLPEVSVYEQLGQKVSVFL